MASEGGDGDVASRIRVLVIVFPDVGELGRVLEAVLQPAQDVELLCGDLADSDLAAQAAVLSELLTTFRPSLLLLCPPRQGLEEASLVFRMLCNQAGEISVIAILETATADELRRLLELGAADFCLAPLRLEDLLPRIRRWSFGGSSSTVLTRQLEESAGLHQMVGRAATFVEAIKQISKLSRSDASVLITGETGTGKEMCARAIHQLGPRAGHPFVPVNCGAIPSELVENELFGHAAGAFTGASTAVRGLIQDAEGGTLFLDEVDSLPLATQVKFLRFLQDQEYRPLGARTTHRANLRIIAASNIDLEEAVRRDRFRSDLLYRLNILPLRLPALRQRQDDIPILARHFLARHARQAGTAVKVLSRAALEKLVAHDWPGNIRELQNIIERALVLSEQSLITAEDIVLSRVFPAVNEASFKALKAQAIAEFESTYVRRLLDRNDGNISRAARAAGKNRRAFWQLMRKHRISPRSEQSSTSR